jgi:hypothetical protein
MSFMYNSILLLVSIFILSTSFAQDTLSRDASFADYDVFKKLVLEVEAHRAERMISLEKMAELSKAKNTIILDTRSKAMYDAKHIKGAVHLTFADFTQATLSRIIPDKDMNVIIYCNNNFLNDQISFPTKSYTPSSKEFDFDFVADPIGITMALNIPTYINLYGYGYRNIYELKDLISVYDDAVEFEGTSVEN